MNWHNEFQNVMRDLLNSPRLQGMVTTMTATLGALSFTEIIHGAFSGCAIVAGTVASVLVARNHFVDYKNKKLQNKILRHQVVALGENPDT